MRRANALTLLLVLAAGFAMAVRINLPPILVNRLVSYTTEGGAFYEKLHFGSYLILLVLPLVLSARRFRLEGVEIVKFRALVWFSAFLCLMVALLFMIGRAGASVFLVDSYISGAAAGLIVLALGPAPRRALGDFVLVMLIVSAVIGTGEAMLQKRLMPYAYAEEVFRPVGLTEHPLALGALSAMAIGFVPLTRWRVWVRIAAIIVLLVGCAASGARFALLLAIAQLPFLLLVLPWRNLNPRQTRAARMLVLIASLAGAGLLLGIMAAGGLMARFGGTIFDDSFFARITVNEVFGLVSWKELMFGMQPADLLMLVNEELGLDYIESAPVAIGLTFGIPMALFFAVLLIRVVGVLLIATPKPAWIATAVTFLAALSNNTLSERQAVIMIFFVLLLAYAPSQRRQDEDGKPPQAIE